MQLHNLWVLVKKAKLLPSKFCLTSTPWIGEGFGSLQIFIMIIDSTFRIGSTHGVCQDYALHNDKFGIISDGCSSSPDTDFGSRIAARTLALHLTSHPNDTRLLDFVALDMRRMADALALPYTSLDATLGYVIGTQGYLYGDGNLIARYSNGHTILLTVDFEGNYPQYLSYDLEPKRMETFKLLQNRKRITRSLFDQDFALLSTEAEYNDDALVHEDFSCYEDGGKLEFVAVTSDGLQSFIQKNGLSYISVPVPEVLKQLTAFKLYTEGFLRRRMNVFSKFCTQNEWSHTDDLSVAVVSLSTTNG